jgi:hypothetical protein
MWLDVGTGKMAEDNIIAWKLASDIELNKDTIENMKTALKEYYLKHVSV